MEVAIGSSLMRSKEALLKLYTTGEAADKIGMPHSTMRWHVKKGNIATTSIRRWHAIEEAELERFRLAPKDRPGPKTRNKKA